MRSMRNAITAAVLLAAALVPLSAAAELPDALSYQGFLADSTGAPVTGEWPMTFAIYAEPQGGTALFLEEFPAVAVQSGVFAVELGGEDGNPLAPALFETGSAWLAITVYGDEGGEELTPRQRIVSSPYAFWALGADVCQQADDASTLAGTAADQFVTFAQVPQVCMTPDAMNQWLSDHGYLPGPYFSDQDVAAFLEANGYVSGPHYSDADVAAYLAAYGYAPGPYFSGSWNDLADVPMDIVYLPALQAGYYDMLTVDQKLAAKAEAGHQHDATYVNEGQPQSISSGMLQPAAVKPVHLDPAACKEGELLKVGPAGTAWDCAEDNDSDTVYSPGDGIAIANKKISVTNWGCSAGQALKRKLDNTGWECSDDKDTDTKYTPGDGLVLVNGAFSVTGGVCQANDVLKRTADNGKWQCSPDLDTTYQSGPGIAIYKGTVSLAINPCQPNQAIKRNAAGNGWTCADDNDTKYSGDNFAVSNQYCPDGTKAVGIMTNGFLSCETDQNTEYSGADFALSNQACDPGAFATGFDADGNLSCEQDVTYSGADFALSAQSCPDLQHVAGIDADGNIDCQADFGSGLAAICSNTYSGQHGRIAMFRFSAASRKLWLRMNTNAHLTNTNDLSAWSVWTDQGTAPGSADIVSLGCSLTHNTGDSTYHLALHLLDADSKSWYNFTWTLNAPPAPADWTGWLDTGSP